MKQRRALFVFVLCMLLLTGGAAAAAAAPAATYTVGGSGANYATLGAAFAAINNGALTGDIILEITGDTAEPAQAALNASGSGSASYTSVMIRPSGGSRTISGNYAGALIQLNGADNVTIDGRQGGVGSTRDLTIDNTNASTSGRTLIFMNDATNNRVQYVTLRGAGTGTSAGDGTAAVIYFYTAASGGSGNDNNTVDNCDIRDSGTTPINAIYSYGTTGAENSGNTISNNNIYNWYHGGNPSNGIHLYSNTTGWTITGNSFYQEASRPVSAVFTPINIGTGSGYVISNNCIGGQAADCGGPAMGLTGGGLFRGIRLAVGASPATEVQGNTIRNISAISSSSNGQYAIGIESGAVNISGNVVESLSFTSGGNIFGIYALSPASVSIDIISNTIADLTGLGTGSYQTAGIAASGVGAFSITGNTVRNLSSASTSTGYGPNAAVIGISQQATGSGQTVARNTVHSLSNTAASATVQVTGIYYNSGAAGGTNRVARNLVHSLSAASSSTGSAIYGILANGGAATYQNNMVRLGIDAAGNSITTGYIIYGIRHNAGASNFYFNTLYVGGTGVAASTYPTAALHTESSQARAAKNNLLVNARSNAAGTATHAAASFSSTSGLTSDYNLFCAPGTGGALVVRGSTTYTLEGWRTYSSQDINTQERSSAAAVNLVNATGASSAVDLHVHSPTAIEGAGSDIGVADDYDGEARSGLTPTDIGADAGLYVTADTTPPVISLAGASLPDLLNPTLANVTVTDDMTGVNSAGPGEGTRARVYYKRYTDDLNALNDNTCNTKGWKYVEASGTGGSPFSFTIDYGLLHGCTGVGAEEQVEYFVVAQDLAAAPNVGISAGTFAAKPASVALTAGAFPLGGTPHLTPAPVTWQGDDATAPTNWHVAANWDSGAVPNSHSSVVIPSAATNYPVVADASVEVAYLKVDSGATLSVSPGRTLTVSEKLTQRGNIMGGGTLDIHNMDWYAGALNNVQATVDGLLTIKGTDKKFVIDGSTLTIEAGAKVVQEATAGNISSYGTADQPALIENLGEWDLQGDADFDRYMSDNGDTRGTFHNAAGAVFKKTGGTGQSLAEITFDNDGIVEVHTGELKLEGRGSADVVSTGQFLVKTGATLVLGQGNAAYGYKVGSADGATGVIKDFPAEGGTVHEGNVRFSSGSTVVDGEYNITGSTTAWSGSEAILSNIVSLGEVDIKYNGKLTLKGTSDFDHNYNITLSEEESGVLAIIYPGHTFNVGTQAAPKNLRIQVPAGGGSASKRVHVEGTLTVWGDTTWSTGTFECGATPVKSVADVAIDVDRRVILKGNVTVNTINGKNVSWCKLITEKTTTWLAGEIQENHAIIENAATGTWKVQQSTGYDLREYNPLPPSEGYADSYFQNYGSFLKQTDAVGAATTTMAYYVSFHNDGLVAVEAGTLALNFGGDSAGTFTVADGATLRFQDYSGRGHHIRGYVCGDKNCTAGAAGTIETVVQGVTTIYPSCTYKVAGTTRVADGEGGGGSRDTFMVWNVKPDTIGTLRVEGNSEAQFTVGPYTTYQDVIVQDEAYLDLSAQFTVAHPGTFTQNSNTNGSRREGAGRLVLDGEAYWNGGAWSGEGITEIKANRTLTINPTAVDVTLADNHDIVVDLGGTVNVTGSGDFWTYAGLYPDKTPKTTNITVEGEWDFQGTGNLRNLLGSPVGTFTTGLFGTVRKSGDTGSSVKSLAMHFDNYGKLAVDKGILWLGNYTWPTGNVDTILSPNLTNQRSVVEGGSSVSGEVVIAAGAELRVQGSVTNNGVIKHTRGDSGLGHFARIFAYDGTTTKYLGLEVLTGDLGAGTEVHVWGNQHCGTAINAEGKEVSATVLRCYQIYPRLDPPPASEISFYYLGATEANGNVSPYAWHWSGDGPVWDRHWDKSKTNPENPRAATASSLSTHLYSTAHGITEYFTFALRDKFSPNAVHLGSFTARSGNGLTALAGLLLAASAVWIGLRVRRK